VISCVADPRPWRRECASCTVTAVVRGKPGKHAGSTAPPTAYMHPLPCARFLYPELPWLRRKGVASSPCGETPIIALMHSMMTLDKLLKRCMGCEREVGELIRVIIIQVGEDQRLPTQDGCITPDLRPHQSKSPYRAASALWVSAIGIHTGQHMHPVPYHSLIDSHAWKTV
jgi:hypothetical protein